MGDVMREQLKEYAKESLNLIDSGIYKSSDGKSEYDIKSDILSMCRNTKHYIKEYDDLSVDMIDLPNKEVKIMLSTKDTLEAARGQIEKFGSSCALNFASAKNPGGGFENGAKAQEEDLCYCSTLFGSLRQEKSLYDYSRKHLNNSLYSTWTIYTPDVIVYRGRNKEIIAPVKCSIITSPAPNRNAYKGKNADVRNAMMERCEYILQTAIKHGERNLVLGAFGCGVFGNSPMEVATIWYNLLYKKNYSRYFDVIEFAILGSEMSENYKAFKIVFIRNL